MEAQVFQYDWSRKNPLVTVGEAAAVEVAEAERQRLTQEAEDRMAQRIRRVTSVGGGDSAWYDHKIIIERI